MLTNTAFRSSDVQQSFSNYAQQSYIDLKVVKYDDTINTTEKNWTLVDLYTKTHNGIYEDFKGGGKKYIMNWGSNERNFFQSSRQSIYIGNGILTIMSDFEK